MRVLRRISKAAARCHARSALLRHTTWVETVIWDASSGARTTSADRYIARSRVKVRDMFFSRKCMLAATRLAACLRTLASAHASSRALVRAFARDLCRLLPALHAVGTERELLPRCHNMLPPHP